MDCFYAAIEMRDDPSLRGKPVAVGGGADQRGVLCTCNYEAREYGVRSAMATGYAQKQCPDLIIIPVNFPKYREASQQIRQIFLEYTELVEPLSLDEAYLDVTECNQHQGSATWMAQAIRKKIFQTTKLTASAGIAPNKFLAKVASDWKKPNGQFVITPEQIDDFVESLPVKKLWGVGPVTAKKLHQRGIQTCADVQQLSLKTLSDDFGKMGVSLFDLCRGIDHREVKPSRIRKSVSVEETFVHDKTSLQQCLDELPLLLKKLSGRIPPTLTDKIAKLFIKIKFNDFSQTTVETTQQIIEQDCFKQLMQEGYERKNQPVRLLGVGVRLKEEVSNEWQQLEINPL